MLSDSVMFQQPDNNRLYIGIGAGNGKQMMVFLHEDGELTIVGENLKMAILKCKVVVKPKKIGIL